MRTVSLIPLSFFLITGVAVANDATTSYISRLSAKGSFSAASPKTNNPQSVSQQGYDSFTGKKLNCSMDPSVIGEKIGDYVVKTSPYGIGMLFESGESIPSDFTFMDCVGISRKGTSIRFDAKWKLPPHSNLGLFLPAPIYPEIMYGSLGVRTTYKLPRKISTTKSLIVSWDYELIGTGPHDLGYVLLQTWLAAVPNPSDIRPEGGMAVKITVVQDCFNSPQRNCFPTDQVGGVEIDGVKYLVMAGDERGSGYQYNYPSTMYSAMFRSMSPPIRKGSVDLKKFAQYLIDNNLIPNGLYFSGIEFGPEVPDGSGELKVKRYSVKIN